MHKGLLAVAVIGLIVSGYLFVAYTTGGPIPCSLNGGCDVVRASSYSHFAGVPTPVFGVIFYVLLAVLAELWKPAASSAYRWALWITVSVGVAVSAFLTYVEAFVIHAWCEWCLVSAAASLLAFIVVWKEESKYESI
jgi:uncharacterized membrane protein